MSKNREDMILANMPLVHHLIKQLAFPGGPTSAGIDYEEAVAYGTEGLIKAVDSYDPSRGTPFSTFAAPRIRGAVLDALRRSDPLTRRQRQGVQLTERARHDLAARLGRWPSRAEISNSVGFSPRDVDINLGRADSRVISLDRIIEKTGDVNFLSLRPLAADCEYQDPATALEDEAMRGLLANAFKSLSEREREIMMLRYRKSLSYNLIAERMGISESRVCQLHKRAVAVLRARIQGHLAAA